MCDEETLETLLERHWNIQPAAIRAVSSGHTNKSYIVECSTGRSVLRMSWRGKAVEQLHREASALAHLGACSNLPALPRIKPTVTARYGAQTRDGRWLHLFAHIEGQVGLADDARAGSIDAMHTLARLHAAMATLPVTQFMPAAGMRAGIVSSAAWVQARHARVSARAAPCLPDGLSDDFELLLTRIGTHLATALAWPGEPTHWLHGDYHAGNLLYVGRTVNGVLDFDDVGLGSHWLEAAFASFAFSRDIGREDRFAFDARAWERGMQAYAMVRRDAVPKWMHENRDALMLLFCADQTLIHLEAAQRGLWTPGEGMGFLGCCRQLLEG